MAAQRLAVFDSRQVHIGSKPVTFSLWCKRTHIVTQNTTLVSIKVQDQTYRPNEKYVSVPKFAKVNDSPSVQGEGHFQKEIF